MYDCILESNGLGDCYLGIDIQNCDLAIYNAINQTLEKLDVSKKYFNAVDELSPKVKAGFHFARLQKLDGQIYVESYGTSWQDVRLDPLLSILHKYQSQIGDLDMIIPLFDENHFSKNKAHNIEFYSAPIFSVNYNLRDLEKIDKINNFILYPDSHVIHHAYHGKIKYLLDHQQTLDSQESFDKAVFRGTANGGGGDFHIGVDTINQHPRFKISLLSYLFQDHLDGQLLGNPTENDKNVKKAKLGRIYKDLLIDDKNQYMDLSEQVRYKYIISLDGHAASWSRPLVVMFSKSLLLYQTDYVQWFQPALQPGKNYLPLKNDLSNLITQIDWARSHKEQVDQIIYNQNVVANKCLTLEKVEEQFLYILKEYSKKFTYKIENKNFPLASNTYNKFIDGVVK